ncbi:hypothetical protein DFH08DRAFT_836000 [Mycena albidolilacea]|uniref:Uncharacterized protein n=1 Tax=Mycena albidolilacea TaxID=1033008 RepID=A0AAD7AS42_9AGAR|nr:hypothetical protein DFH08DRAFT_836000 [Mycena albidolilacea]
MSTGLYTTTLSDLNDMTLEERPQAQQVDRLTEMLVVQNRIKEGAQNLLNIQDLADTLRKQLVFELDQALAKIEFIQRRIEILTAAT